MDKVLGGRKSVKEVLGQRKSVEEVLAGKNRAEIDIRLVRDMWGKWWDLGAWPESGNLGLELEGQRGQARPGSKAKPTRSSWLPPARPKWCTAEGK